MEMAKVKLSQLTQHGDLLDMYGACIRVLGQRELIRKDVLEAVDRAVSMTEHNKDAILNICFPYTSHDEITTAIRNTVIEYSKPLPSQNRSFSESHIAHNIQSRRLSATRPTARSLSPGVGTTSDREESVPSNSSSSTLHPDSPFDTLPADDDDDYAKYRETYPDPESITPEILNDHMYTAGLPPVELLVRTSGVERLSDFLLWQCHQNTEIVFLETLWPEFDLWTFLPVLVEWQWKRRKGAERRRGIRNDTESRSLKVIKDR